MVPQLSRIDSKNISPSDRIKAKQSLESDLIKLKAFVRNLEINPPKEKKFSKEDRKRMFQEECEEKQKELEKEKKREKPKFEVTRKKGEKSKFKFDGERRMCNEFKCNWTMEEYIDPEFSELRVDLPKFLDTSEIDVEISGKWVAIQARNDLFQMKFWEEVYSNPVKLQRSAITGQLFIKMRKKKIDPLLMKKRELQQEEEKKRKEQEKKDKQLQEEEKRKEKEFREKQIKKVYGGFLDCDKDEESFDEDDLEELEGLSANSLESLD